MIDPERARFTRRHLLQLGAAGLAAACGAGCQTTARIDTQPPAPPPPWGIDLGVQSYSLRAFSFDDAVAKAQELRLHFIEPFPGHLPQNSAPDRLAAVKALLATHDVKLNAYGVCGLNKDADAARRLFDFVKQNDIPVITANPAKDSFDTLDKLVEEYDVRVAVHNHGPGSLWSKTDQMLEAIKDHHPHIGVCLDTGHLVRAGDDPVEAVRTLGPRLHGVHMKDYNEQNHDVAIGRGRADLVGFFTALKEADFDGAFSIEYEIDSKNPVPGLAESIASIRAIVSRLA